jgi:hypothetical protein
MRHIPYPGKCFNNATQFNFFRIKRYEDFLFREVNPGRQDAGMDAVNIFQKPEATTTVDLREIKRNMSLIIIRELNEFTGDLRIIQESKFIRADRIFLGDARALVEIVIRAKVGIMKDLIHTPATGTTKHMIP